MRVYGPVMNVVCYEQACYNGHPNVHRSPRYEAQVAKRDATLIKLSAYCVTLHLSM